MGGDFLQGKIAVNQEKVGNGLSAEEKGQGEPGASPDAQACEQKHETTTEEVERHLGRGQVQDDRAGQQLAGERVPKGAHREPGQDQQQAPPAAAHLPAALTPHTQRQDHTGGYKQQAERSQRITGTDIPKPQQDGSHPDNAQKRETCDAGRDGPARCRGSRLFRGFATVRTTGMRILPGGRGRENAAFHV